MVHLSAEILLNLGFRDIAKWVIDDDNSAISYVLDGANAKAHCALLEVRNALYAFVQGDEIKYIGKTCRSIEKRFTGYCKPGKTQQTNRRCHHNIKTSLNQGMETRILVFTPVSHLRYGDFAIDLAAGLEEALIVAFNPPWNGHDGQRLLTEEAEREATEEVNTSKEKGSIGGGEAPLDADKTTISEHDSSAAFQIKLGSAYYNQGLINPGVEASNFLGNHGDPVIVYLGNKSEQIDSLINRTANANSSVRIVGNNRLIANWFQRHFNPGDVVQGEVQDPQHVLLLLPAS